MSDGADNNPKASLLSASEPSPFYVLNPLAELPILLVCDHASCRIPNALGDMGLDPFARRCHLAIDIGAGKLTEQLAASLGVTAVVAQYSRLVVDCNRECCVSNESSKSAVLMNGERYKIMITWKVRYGI